MGYIKFNFQVGRLIKGKVIRNLKRECFKHNLDITIDEDMGFFGGDLFVKIKGDDPQVLKAFATSVEQWVKDNNR